MTVTLYSTTTCNECVPIKDYLDSMQILYIEKLVDKDNEAAKEMVEISGQKSVPVLIFKQDDKNERIIVGHEMEKIAEVVKNKV